MSVEIERERRIPYREYSLFRKLKLLDKVLIKNPNLKWQVEPTGELSVIVPIQVKGMFGITRTKEVKCIFEEDATRILNLLDGKRTVREVAKIFAEEKHYPYLRRVEIELEIFLTDLLDYEIEVDHQSFFVSLVKIVKAL
jgi:hypothetical protein